MKRLFLLTGLCIFLVLFSGCEMLKKGVAYTFSESRSIIQSIEFGSISVENPSEFQAETEVPLLKLSSFLNAFQEVEFRELPGIYGTSTDAIRINYMDGNYEIINGKLAIYGYADEDGSIQIQRKWLTCNESELFGLIRDYAVPVEQGTFPYSEPEEAIKAVEIVYAADEFSFEVISSITEDRIFGFLEDFRRITFRKSTNPPFPSFEQRCVRIVYSSGNYDLVMNSVSVFVDVHQGEKPIGRIIDYYCDSDQLKDLISGFSSK